MMKLREVNEGTIYGAGETFEMQKKTLFRSLGMKGPL